MIDTDDTNHKPKRTPFNDDDASESVSSHHASYYDILPLLLTALNSPRSNQSKSATFTSKAKSSSSTAKAKSSSTTLSKSTSLLNPSTTRPQPKKAELDIEKNLDVLYPEDKLPPHILTSFQLNGEHGRSYKHQYANVYFMRLAALKPAVKANAKKLWEDVAGESLRYTMRLASLG